MGDKPRHHSTVSTSGCCLTTRRAHRSARHADQEGRVARHWRPPRAASANGRRALSSCDTTGDSGAARESARASRNSGRRHTAPVSIGRRSRSFDRAPGSGRESLPLLDTGLSCAVLGPVRRRVSDPATRCARGALRPAAGTGTAIFDDRGRRNPCGLCGAHRDIADGGDGGIRIRLCLLEAETRQFDPFIRCFIRCLRAA